MKTEKSMFYRENNVKLYMEKHFPEKGTKACVVLIHGANDHIGRYKHIGKHFANKGICVYGFDMRGHGKSPGKRGHIGKYSLVLDDIHDFVSKVSNENPDKPIIIYGQSMGGNFALNYLAKKPHDKIKGAVITSPLIKLYKEPSRFKVKMLTFLSKIMPMATINSGLCFEDFTSDPNEIEKCRNDTLITKRISLQTSVEAYNSGIYIYNNPQKIKVPFLLTHGSEDCITSFEASKSFVNRSNLGKFIPFEGAKHEPHNEGGKYKVLDKVMNWIEDDIFHHINKNVSKNYHQKESYKLKELVGKLKEKEWVDKLKDKELDNHLKKGFSGIEKISNHNSCLKSKDFTI